MKKNHKLNNKFYKETWFFQSVMEQINESIIITDLSENIIFVNKATERIYGYKKEELLGKNTIMLNAEIEADKIQKEISNNLKKDKTWQGNIKNKKKNGDIISIALSVCPLRDKNNDTVAFLGVQKDITNLKRTQSEISVIMEQLMKTNKELERSNKELEEFAYVASHDLQEPLRVISTYTEILKEKSQECYTKNKDYVFFCALKETSKWFDYIINASNRLETLVTDLLDFSRAGSQNAPFKFFDPNEIVEEVSENFDFIIQQKKAQIIIETFLPKTFGIKSKIKQLFHNLISNSLKFAGDKEPIIRIGCVDKESYWLFYINDNGVGIDPDNFDRIFGIFKRLYSKDEIPGTGIGLSICKRIVENHGGKIWIDSEVNEGTTFYFTISKSLEIK